MATVTQRFRMLPWKKGWDSDTDEGIMQFDGKGEYCVRLDDIIFTLSGGRRKRDGFDYHDSSAISGTPTIMGGFDYWANLAGVKTQKIVVWDGQATSKCWIQPAAGGAWTELAADTGVTAPTSLKRVVFEVFNEDLVMAVTDTVTAGVSPFKWDNQDSGNEYVALGGTPPPMKYIRKHQGRLWGAGDPEHPDRLHYSTPGNHEEWEGIGDSSYLEVEPGDGDPVGITAILPSFRGQLFVAKRNKIYKVTGTDPLSYKIESVSEGLGCISHNSCVAVDLDDVYFASERGFHSLVLTDKFGDFEGSFLSETVQTEYLACDEILKQYTQGVWIPSLNSVIWTMSRNGTQMDHFWLYDIRYKAWYRWQGANPTALFRVEDSSTGFKRAFFGNNVGRLSKTQVTGIYHDYTDTAISQEIVTPYIWPDNNPSTVKAFKKITIWAKMPQGETLTCLVRFPGMTEEQELTFTSNSSGTAKLDVDFIMGTSVLGADAVLRMTPYTLPIDGVSETSAQLTFVNDTVDSYCELFGWEIEYEQSGFSQETKGVG